MDNFNEMNKFRETIWRPDFDPDPPGCVCREGTVTTKTPNHWVSTVLCVQLSFEEVLGDALNGITQLREEHRAERKGHCLLYRCFFQLYRLQLSSL